MTRPEDFLPLRPVELEILFAVRNRVLHGYGILHEAERAGRAVPGLVTVYRALQRMERRGLVARAEDEGDPDAGDDRRRSYRATPLGSQVLHLEALRLRPLVQAALKGTTTAGEDVG